MNPRPHPCFSAFGLILAAILAFGHFRALAAPATDAVLTLKQPDGTTFSARLYGDEFFNYYSTLDGRPIVYDEASKLWTYALPQEEGVGNSSGLVVGQVKPPALPWKPKAPLSELEARKTRQYTASVPTVRQSRARGNGSLATTANIAMLLTKFSDRTTQTTKAASAFETLFFSTSDPNAFTMANLYRQMSYNLHTPTSGPAGIQNWATAPNTHDYYGGGPQASGHPREDGLRVQELVRWRAANADATMDFGPYDTNNDGFVDLVCVVFQGTSQAGGGPVEDIWPVRWNLAAETDTTRGVYTTGDRNAENEIVKVRDFIVIPENRVGTPTDPAPITTIGLLCHEYGHGIGWPDLYDVPNNDPASAGVGAFCLMGAGNWNTTPGGAGGDRPCWANAYLRAQCGWVTPQVPTSNWKDYRINEAKRENQIIRMTKDGANSNEFYLLERRQATGFDAGIPGGGLFIWHVDTDVNSNNAEWWFISAADQRTNGGHYRVAFEQADKRFDLEKNVNQGDATDPFGPGAEFSKNTIPSSNDYANTVTDVAVRNIREAGDDYLTDLYVKADDVFPEVQFSNPEDGHTYISVSNLQGTASDNAAVQLVRCALRRNNGSTTEWYDWTTNDWNAAPYDAAKYEKDATGTASWSAAVVSERVTPGSYTLFAKAWDTSGGASDWRYISFNVMYDPNGPNITYAAPAAHANLASSSPGSFSGNVVNYTGSSTKKLALEKISETPGQAGSFLNWSNNTFGTPGQWGVQFQLDQNNANLTWSVDLNGRGLPRGRYAFWAKLYTADSRESPWQQRYFRIDYPPTVAILSPSPGASISNLGPISGNYLEPTGTGVQGGGVRLTFTDNIGRYWTGTNWSSTPFVLTAPISNGTWYFDAVPSGGNLGSGVFNISASLTTNSGESAVPGPQNQIEFRIDRDPPSAAIASPVANTLITTPTLPAFHGTAGDSGAVAYINAYIRRESDSAYWTGGSWSYDSGEHDDEDEAAGQPAPTVVVLPTSYNASTGAWTCTANMPRPGMDMLSGNYTYIIIAGDRAGNYVQVDAPVVVDYHASFVWSGSYNQDWNIAWNWRDESGGYAPRVPGSADIAVIANGAEVNCNSNPTLYGLNLSNGKLSLTTANFALTTTGPTTWTGGTVAGTWDNRGTVTVSGAGPKSLWDTTTLNNYGTIIWAGDGPIRARAYTGGRAALNNKSGGVFRITGAGSVFSRDYSYRRPIFNNESGAKLERDGTGGFASLSVWEFHNAGEIRAQTGILTFLDGPFDGYDLFLNPGTTLTGEGYLRINNATQLNTAVHAECEVEMVDNSWLGCPAGPGVAKFEGKFNWWGGVIYGDLTIGSAGIVNITDPVPATQIPKVLWDSTTLHNDGIINWMGGAPLRARAYTDGTATVNNRAGAFFNLTADGTPFAREYSYRTPVFNNEVGGTFRKTGGSGSAVVNTFNFNHRGGMVCNAGVLAFSTTLDVFSPTPWTGSGDFEQTGGITIVKDTLALSGPTFTISAGEVWGAEDGSGVLATTAGSSFEWLAGTFWRTLKLADGSQLNLSGPALKVLWDDTTLNNEGTITWQGGGPLRARAYTNTTAVVNNRSGARFQVAADGDVFAREYTYRTPLFNNLAGATFARTAGAGAANVHSFTFNNDGAIVADTGMLAFNTTLNLQNSGTLSGQGSFTMPGGVVNVTGATLLTGSSFSVLGGDIVGLAGAVWNTAEGGAWRWLGGTLSGTLELGTASLLQIADPPAASTIKTLWDNAVLNNRGTITWAGAGPMRARAYTGVEAVINNKSGAVFRLESDGAAFTREYNSKLPRFTNELGARFEKLTGNAAVATLCDWRFDNLGEMEVVRGKLNLSQGGDSSGDFQTYIGAFIRFTGGSHTLRNGTSFDGNGNVQVDGGTVIGDGSLNANIAAPGAFDLVSGTLAGATNYMGVGLFHWTGGTVSGTLTLAGGTHMDLDGPATKVLWDSTTIHNHGTMRWFGGGMIQARAYTDGAAVINNRDGGVFGIASDGNVFTREYTYRRPLFNNNQGARFEKQSGTGDSVFTIWEFHNAGEIRCGTGTLAFVDNPNDGYDLFLEPGTTLTGAGRLRLQTATHLTTAVNATCPVDLPENSWFGCPPPAEGGSVARFEGTMNWTGGVIWGELIVGPAGILNLGDAVSGTPVPKILWDSTTLHNEGVINWTGGGPLRARAYTDGTAVVNNRAGAFYNLTADGTPFAREYNSRQPIFNNEVGATFRKTAGSASANVNTFNYNHRGSMVCESGVLAFNTALDVLSPTPWTGAGDFELTGGVATINDTLTLNGPTFTWSAGDVWGAVNGSGALATTGGSSVEWKSGTLWRALKITAGSHLNLSGPAVKVLWDDTTLTNEGTIVWQGGGPLRARAYTNATAIVNNQLGAHFHVAAAGDALTREYTSRVPIFNNAGTFQAGSPIAAVGLIGWNFTQLASGNLLIDLAGPATTEHDRLTITGTTTLAGTLSATKLNGYAPAKDTLFPFLTGGPVSGAFANVVGSFTTEYTANSATLRAQTPPLPFTDWATAAGLTGPNSLPNADPDGDGLSNFAEYVFNTSPAGANAAPQATGVQSINGQNWLVLTYRRWADREAAGVTYAPQTASSLSGWNTTGIIDEADPAAPPIAGSTPCRCRVLVAPGVSKFLRVRASRP